VRRLAVAVPPHALGAILLGVSLLALAAVGRDSHSEECRFEQMWYAGSIHSNERIEFRADSTGTWIQSGFDDHAGHDRKEFRWSRTASTLTVLYDGSDQATVPYTIRKPYNTCHLTFDVHPFSDQSPFRDFADWANF
jgi:hypothetical protein